MVMKASDIVKQLPASAGPARESAIIEVVRAGHYLPIEWVEVEVNRMGQTGKFWVARDALALGELGDAVRVNVTAATAQRLADMLNATMPTTFLLDTVKQRFGDVVYPCIQAPDSASRVRQGLSPSMSDTLAMVTHSQRVDEAIKKKPLQKVVCNVGKHWVLTNFLASKPEHTAANYGWFSVSAPYVSASGQRMWQTLGTKHNDQHVDYSQVFQPVRAMVEANGKLLSFLEVAEHPEFWPLVSDEGMLKVSRQPGVPRSEPKATFTEQEPTTMNHRVEGLVSMFLEARNFTKVDRSADVRQIVIHTAEIAETLTSAEALCRWAAGPHAARASWHFAVDADSITQSVREEYIAWHAPGCNRTGIGIELCGRAKQTAKEWEDDFSRATLERAAKLVAYLCLRWSIPVQFVDAEGLRRGVRGITTHAEVTKAFRKSTHTDPGPAFPLAEFLSHVQREQLP